MNPAEVRSGSGSAVPSSVARRSDWLRNGGLLLTLAFTYFLYSPATGFEFVYDDVFQIVQNDHLDSWRYLPVYFSQHLWSHLPQVPANFYRPLFLVWLRLNNVLFGHEPTGWHLGAILLHLGMVGLCYLLAKRLLRQTVPALLTALVFAVHPTHLESVAWISGANEPLGGVFFLTSLLCYLRAREEKKPWWTVAAAASFAAAVLTKETAAVLPLVLVAYELTMGRSDQGSQASSGRAKRLARQMLPYVAVLAAYLLVRSRVLHELTHNMNHVPLSTSLLTWPWLICLYVRQMFWPFSLSPLYDMSFVTSPLQWRFVLPIAGLLAIVFSFWLLHRRRRELPLFLLFWFGITLAPALVVFCVALPAEGFHDRYLYLPSLAFALAIGAVFGASTENRAPARKIAAAFCVALAVVGFAVGTRTQLGYWQNNYALFQRAAQIAPGNEIANLNFATQLIKRGEYAKALGAARQAVLDNPASAPAEASAGAAAFFSKDYVQAAQFYEKAIALGPPQADWYYSVGLSRLNLKQFEAAKMALQNAVQANPRARGVHYALGLAETHLGKWQAASEQFAAELALDGSSQAARSALEQAQVQAASPETRAQGGQRLHRAGLQIAR